MDVSSALNLSSFVVGSLVFGLLAVVAYDRLPVVSEELKTKVSDAKTAVERKLPVRHRAPVKPLTRAQVIQMYPTGTWQRIAYDEFSKVLLDEELIFPCIYATKGYKADNQVYTFIDSDDLSDPRHIRQLADCLEDYLPRARSLGPNTSLVLFTKHDDSPRSVDEYHSLFWKMLDGVAKLDKKPWPVSVPRTIDNAEWCFCFDGEPVFAVAQTPAHQTRRTRYAKGVTILFQPKWVFDNLFSNDVKRAAAISKVRSLVAKYDPIPVSPDLKNYGEPDSREFKQYYLLDENVSATCPYKELSPSEVLAG